MALFKSNLYETPLTEAILSDDESTLLQLSKYKDQVLAENELCFNAIELAQYLDKSHLTKILSPIDHQTKVVSSEGETLSLNRAAFESFFKVHYLNRLRFSSYKFFQKVLKSCSWVLKTDLFAEDVIELGKEYRKGVLGPFSQDILIQWIDDRLGYGVFANKDFEVGEYILENIRGQCDKFPGLEQRPMNIV